MLVSTFPTVGAILAGGATSFSRSSFAIRWWSVPGKNLWVQELLVIMVVRHDVPTWALLPPALIFLSVPTTAPDRRAYRDASHLRLKPFTKNHNDDIPLWNESGMSVHRRIKWRTIQVRGVSGDLGGFGLEANNSLGVPVVAHCKRY